MPTPLWILAAIALALVAAALLWTRRAALAVPPTPADDEPLQSFADAAGEW